MYEAGMLVLSYKAGTLEMRGPGVGPEPLAAGGAPGGRLGDLLAGELAEPCSWDPRAACLRAPASAYAGIILALRRHEIPVEDEARAYLCIAFLFIVRFSALLYGFIHRSHHNTYGTLAKKLTFMASDADNSQFEW